MILNTLLIGEGAKAEKKSSFSTTAKKNILTFRFEPLMAGKRYPMTAYAETDTATNTDIVLDSYGKPRLVESETNVRDLASLSFNMPNEQVLGITVTDKTRTVSYDTDRGGQFNMFLGIESGDCDVLSIITKRTTKYVRNGDTTIKKYTVYKKDGELGFTEEEHEGKYSKTFNLGFLQPSSLQYTKAVIRRSDSVINSVLVDAIQGLDKDTYIKAINMDTIADSEEIVDRLDALTDLRFVILVDQPEEMEKRMKTYLGKTDIPLFRCLCYTSGKKELVAI